MSAKLDSPYVCFVQDWSYPEVVRLHPEADAPGEIVGLDGALLGRHEGVIPYTVIQNRKHGARTHHNGE